MRYLIFLQPKLYMGDQSSPPPNDVIVNESDDVEHACGIARRLNRYAALLTSFEVYDTVEDKTITS